MSCVSDTVPLYMILASLGRWRVGFLRFLAKTQKNRKQKTGFFKEMVDFRTFLDNEAAVDPQCLAGNE